MERRESHRDHQVYALTTPPATGGEGESHREHQVYALTTHQLQVERRESIETISDALTTHSYRWRGDRDIEIKCSAHHTPATGERRGVIKTIKCMRSPHTATGGEDERVIRQSRYALTTHQLQVERRESHRDNQVYALTTHSYRWRGESIETSRYAHHTPATGGEERES